MCIAVLNYSSMNYRLSVYPHSIKRSITDARGVSFSVAFSHPATRIINFSIILRLSTYSWPCAYINFHCRGRRLLSVLRDVSLLLRFILSFAIAHGAVRMQLEYTDRSYYRFVSPVFCRVGRSAQQMINCKIIQ